MSKGTTQRDINAAERARLALQLRKKGATLDEIAKQCGYQDKSGAFRAIKRSLRDLPVEDAEELRKLEYARLEYLEMLCHQQILDKKKDPLWAVDRLIQIGKARRELMNLDKHPEEDLAAQSYTKRIILTHETTEGQSDAGS